MKIYFLTILVFVTFAVVIAKLSVNLLSIIMGKDFENISSLLNHLVFLLIIGYAYFSNNNMGGIKIKKSACKD